jgi:hypothetical protein
MAELALSPWPQGKLEGRDAFVDLVVRSVEIAAEQGVNALCWMDPDFEDWPLGERRLQAALQAWGRTGRRMVLMAGRFDRLVQRHHRFVSWRQQWAHIIECWQCPKADLAEYPSAILLPQWSMRRIDVEQCVCVLSAERAAVLALQELRQQWLRKSSKGFPATVLGL